MLKPSAQSAVRLRGVRQNNLKNFDLDLPLKQLIVITGLSGSGKSSLAFETLFAEGQRRYLETFSPYARQFFDRMDKPRVDSIEGIPPAIAIEQRNAVKTTRSTVGTMTEICDYLKALWPQVARLHCRQCGRLVRKETPQEIWQTLLPGEAGSAPDEILITFDVPLSEKLSLEESRALVAKQGYQRILLNHKITRLDELPVRSSRSALRLSHFTVIQDRLKLAPANRARFVEACEQAYHFGKGKLALRPIDSENSKPKTENLKLFSNRFHCAHCDLEYREPSPALFSFNHPVGACPTCKGFGRVISIDYDLAIPDRSKTLAEGVVKPWQTGHGAECQRDLLRMCRHFEIPTDLPFQQLPQRWQDFVIDGDPLYGTDEEHEWPRAWYGVKGYFRWLESKSYKMHVRVLLSRYRAYTTCPDCHGARFQPEALLYRMAVDDLRLGNRPSNGGVESKPDAPTGNRKSEITLADFYALPIRDALRLIEALAVSRLARSPSRVANDPLSLILSEVRARLTFLAEVGLDYLTLDRPTRSLSGGETERVNLTTCLGTRLVNTLFVLDEPSVGLHPRDTERLVGILQRLRDAGNTVVVVEHEASVMRAADQIIDLGPGHGATGGQLVFQGSYPEILHSPASLTGRYLSGAERIEIPVRRAVQSPRLTGLPILTGRRKAAPAVAVLNDAISPISKQPGCPTVKVVHATRHNLNDLSVEFPLGRFVCVTGVSGSGKTTLIREVVLPLLEAKLKPKSSPGGTFSSKASDRFEDLPSPDRSDESNGSDDGADDESDRTTARRPQAASLSGGEALDHVVLVDQSILGKTPRSNPAVYIGAFDDIREFFAQSDPAKQRGLNASAFSFNSSQGQCERCRGAGFEKIEMQFLSDVFIRCPDCNGRRYRQHILDVKCEVRRAKGELKPDGSPFALHTSSFAWSIADLLDATIDEGIEFLAAFPDSRPAARAVESLKLLQEVGLGYLRLGQPINTLSGGESQRLKLVRHLAEATEASAKCEVRRAKDERQPDGSPFPLHTSDFTPTLFLFDEPTTGLHFDDVRVLLKVFQRLVDAGHSVWVIEHNLDVIKSADWVIDLGPDAGDNGGRIVAQGTPEQIAACEASHTGRALKAVLKSETERIETKGTG
jgi:excinuclease ABC subunit A